MSKKQSVTNRAALIRGFLVSNPDANNAAVQEHMAGMNMSATSAEIATARKKIGLAPVGRSSGKRAPALKDEPSNDCPNCVRLQAQNLALRKVIGLLLAVE